MEQYVYLLEYNNKIIGTYTNLDLAKQFINGCIQNNFITSNVFIKKYYKNSCYCVETENINNNTNTNTNIVKSSIDYNSPIILDMAKQKIDIQHKINLLKTQKKKIEESKNTFYSDLILFNLFTENKKKDENFTIPEIFAKKFELMTNLKLNNKLSWENFAKEYHHDNLYNEYFDTNNYDKTFLNDDSEEELSIESESSTEDSVQDSN